MDIRDHLLADTSQVAWNPVKRKGRIDFGTHPAVLVIDMSQAFVEPSYPLAGATRPEGAIHSISKLVSAGRRQRIPILFTTIRTPRNEADWGRWTRTKLRTHPELLQDETWTIIPELTPQSGESVIYKNRPSGFFGTNLASLLIFQGIDTVIVTGMTTSGCVRATVVDAFSYNFKVIVPVECVADSADLSHRVSLFDIDRKYGHVLPLRRVLQYLKRIG